MLGFDLLPSLAIFGAGMLTGLLLTLLLNKLRTGSISAGKIRQDMDAYQMQVEAHFDETSEKFKKMAEHYQELYDHLSIGATTLCRPEHVAPGLTDQRSETNIDQDTEPLQTDADPQQSGAGIDEKVAGKSADAST